MNTGSKLGRTDFFLALLLGQGDLTSLQEVLGKGDPSRIHQIFTFDQIT